MNRYASQLRTVVAPNALVAQINPPTDLVIAQADWSPQLFRFAPFNEAVFNYQANFRFVRLGLFCNVADGLIFKTFTQKVDLHVEGFVFTAATLVTGTAIQVTQGLNTIQCTGADGNFSAELSGGNFIRINVLGYEDRIFQIRTVDDDNNLTLYGYSDYSLLTAGPTEGIEVLTWTQISSANSFVSNVNIPVLNYMVETDKLFSPALNTSLTSPILGAFFLAQVNSIQTLPLEFLTKTIDTTLAGDNAIFDVVADVEFT